MSSSDMIVGIDLGTTNSAVAVCRDGRIEVVRENGSELLPSCVGLQPDGRLIVGAEARNQYVLYPERTVRSIKRKMGTGETVSLGDRACSPQEISAIILRELKERAQRYLGVPVSKAVVTVPAYFNDAQRQATREAGVIAGLDVLRILNEPTAACLAYETREKSASRTVLAFDFGGGTFDVSIVQVEGDLVEVVASHGDTQLGGDDIDELIAERLFKAVCEQQKTPSELTSIGLNRVRRASEEAKIRLSDEPFTRIIEDNLPTAAGGREHLEVELSREELDKMVAPLLERTMNSVRHALAAAGKRSRDIDEVLLVGGSTRMACVAGMLQRELGREPRRDVHPELAVVYGAGVMAARLMGAPDQRILVDITPYTFGTSAMGMTGGEYGPYLFCPIIKAGTPLPVSRSDVFFTMVDGQERVNVTVFEGEDEDARRNILIGQFHIEGLDPDAPSGSEIVLGMSLDLDGMLRVTATEKHTGLSRNVVIERALDKLSDSQIADSRAQIEDLFGGDGTMHGVDTGEEADVPGMPSAEGLPAGEGDEGAVRKARHLRRRLAKAIAGMDPVDREDAENLDRDLETALDNGDTAALERIATEIEDLLFYVESAQ